MRIIGGNWGGRPIESPKGRDVSRPTTDRVREAVASMLESARDGGIEGSRVLDSFAGSGALGIEMLSRGAGHAVFFDIDRGATALVRRNLDKVACDPGRTHVICGDVVANAKRGRIPGSPFDLVLIDPPYALGARPAQELIAALSAHDLLDGHALVLFERPASSPPLEVAGFTNLRDKRYGQTAIDLLRRD